MMRISKKLNGQKVYVQAGRIELNNFLRNGAELSMEFGQKERQSYLLVYERRKGKEKPTYPNAFLWRNVINRSESPEGITQTSHPFKSRFV